MFSVFIEPILATNNCTETFVANPENNKNKDLLILKIISDTAWPTCASPKKMVKARLDDIKGDWLNVNFDGKSFNK